MLNLIEALRRGDPKMPNKKLQRYARYLYDIAHGLH